MAAMSDYLENKLLDHVLGNTAFTQPANLYLALFTSDPADDASGTECSGNAYARTAITFNAASGGAADNAATVTFPTPTPGDWGTVTHFGIFDAATAGNLLVHGALTTSKVTAASDPVEFLAGDVTITAT